MNAAYVKYIASLLLFGTNGIVASYIALASCDIVLLRTFIGSILLIGIFLLLRGKFTFFRFKKDFLFLILSGVTMGTYWMFVYEAYQQIGVGLTSLAYACGPIIVMILSPVLFREKLTWSKIAGFAAVVLGMIFVSGQAVVSGTTAFGLFCGAMSAIMYAVMIIFNKKAKNITGLENATLQLFISFLTVAVFVGLTHGLIFEIRSGDLLPILILGVVNTSIGCYLYFSAIGKLSVQTVAICDYIEPLSAVIFAGLLLQEVLLPLQVLGAVLIIGGAVFGETYLTIKKHCRVS
ncbi:MAG: DMT family transporter [Methanocorpusculum sp.]|nr:DMT family transporter [Methanocorpusculum sp.]